MSEKREFPWPLSIALNSNVRETNQGISPWAVRDDLKCGYGFIGFFLGTLTRPFQGSTVRHCFPVQVPEDVGRFLARWLHG
ncbi:Uncharacterised protein [Leclercia adecarboxylata]|uniref:Uncharacterized protein n=1 Tax=Leclercia adecarboxylata TaxID=83655 RepID=A0A4U9IU40_9ENTR|nr:Uncharacterised protein [Leclercia adecarboxylata]